METSRQETTVCLVCKGELGLAHRTVVHKKDGSKARVCGKTCQIKAKKLGYE